MEMKRIINTEHAPKAVGPYSQGVAANGFLFISGQMPVDPATSKVVGNNVAEQTEQVLKNIEAILKEAGLTFDNVVKTTCLLSDMDNFVPMNEVYAKYFTKEMPARAAYGVVRLPLGVMIEIEAIAVL